MSDILQNSIETAVEMKAGNQDAQSYINDLRADVRSGSPRAISTLQDLVNLIVITYNEATLLQPNMKEFINQFIDEPRDDNGNGRRYIKHFPKVPQNYDITKFIPTQQTPKAFKVQFIKFKKDNGDLDTLSVQKKYEIVYIQSELITYFINHQLRTFIEEQILGQIQQSMEIFLYDYVMTKLVDTEQAGAGTDNTPTNHPQRGKVVNGTKNNLFECIVELITEVKKMKQNSSDYNVDQTLREAIDASKTEDLILLVSPKVKAMFETEIITQLFNSANIQLDKHFGQIHVPNRKFVLTGATATVAADSYMPDNKLIVIDRKNYLRILTMLKVPGGDYYPINMANLQVLHHWLAAGYLPWGKVLTYKSSNLTVSPSA